MFTEKDKNRNRVEHQLIQKTIVIIFIKFNHQINHLPLQDFDSSLFQNALDGYFARKAKAVTHFGKWLDPAADFIVIISILVYLVGTNQFPVWFFIFYLCRHIIIAGFAIYCINYGYMILHANWWGKWATGISTLGIFLHIFELNTLPWLKMASVYIATMLLLISMVQYLKQFIISIRSSHDKFSN